MNNINKPRETDEEVNARIIEALEKAEVV